MVSGPNGQSGVPAQNHVEEVQLHEQEAATILLPSGAGNTVLERLPIVLSIVRLRAQVHKVIHRIKETTSQCVHQKLSLIF